MFLIKTKPVWAEADEGGGASADAAPAADTAAKDTTETLYPDDKPAGDKPADKADASAAADDVSKTETDGNAEWKPYVDDPNKTPEENAAAKAEHDAGNPVNQVPEDGKYELTMPDGVELDTGLVDALSPVMKEAGVSRGQAQKLAEGLAQHLKADADKRSADWAQTIQGWADAAAKDPEMGGAKWDETLAAAKSATTRFGTPALREYLEVSGAGNHPEVIRLMAKVGAMIGEDVPAVSDNPGKGATQDAASKLYPDDKPKG